MTRCLTLLVLMLWAPAATAQLEAPTPLEPPRGRSVDVVWSQGVEGITSGEGLEAPRRVDVSGDGCLRVLVGDAATLSLCGAAHLDIVDDAPSLAIRGGRGALWVVDHALTVMLDGRALRLQRGIAVFDTSRASPVILVAGTGSFDGQPLQVMSRENTRELLDEAHRCGPQRPQLNVPLGEPAAIAEAVEVARTQEADDEGENASAEGGATCIDSADSASATDPTQGPDSGIDPDARRDEEGILRIRIRLPTSRR